ncbi:MAG: hypothetical protein ETSY2_47240 [Candidatus Entotheonella gemina]|uniref:Uncharacterized protein n=1 Tax=Candidatus Entotheonella gemina TaxID=1429439 RepID=W4LD35_9BACT|nr:MAG: hypothetical protein ETSY2_47240 [Candidatus Entotheonella gemina]
MQHRGFPLMQTLGRKYTANGEIMEVYNQGSSAEEP